MNWALASAAAAERAPLKRFRARRRATGPDLRPLREDALPGTDRGIRSQRTRSPQTLFSMKAGMFSGSPALIAACRAGFCPSPAGNTFTMMTSSTSVPLIPVRRMTSLITTAAPWR